MTLLDRVERAYDAFPRRPGVRVEAVGPFDLFVREGPGWPLYARPRLGAVEITGADVDAVLARQAGLGVPQQVEWVMEVTPALLPAITGRLPVLHAPLMVLNPALLPAERAERADTTAERPDATVAALATAVVLDPWARDFVELHALAGAVAHLAFADEGTAVGAAGPAQRDATVRPPDPDALAAVTATMQAGLMTEAVVVDPIDGVVASGSYQAALGAAEIVGVATLPTARRRGHGAAVTAALARHALARGNDLVFLSAASEDVAAIYARIGFRRIGTAGIAQAGGH